MAKDILYPLRRLHGELHDVKVRHNLRKSYMERFREKPKTVFLLMTPEHGNIGDHGIAYSEKRFLTEFGLNYIEITSERLSELSRHNLVGALNGFPLLINGGGNMGTLWKGVEDLQREIILKNPKSDIIFLPNTIFYEDSDWGRKEFEKSKKIYNRHKKLLLYAREKTSYEVMRKAYRKVKLIPDMVLSMPQQGTERVRQGCLLCLRGDKEKTRTLEQEQLIRRQAEQLFGKNVTDTDMVIPGSISTQQREAALQAKFREFCGAELVITDRLHGMIFCAITGTPCIVIDSKSPKVRGCYEWIKHLDYIRFANDFSSIAEQYQKIPQAPHIYNNSHLTHYYEELANDILSIF